MTPLPSGTSAWDLWTDRNADARKSIVTKPEILIAGAGIDGFAAANYLQRPGCKQDEYINADGHLPVRVRDRHAWRHGPAGRNRVTMKFYNTEQGVADYIAMAEGYDGRELIAELQNYLQPGTTVLELGMGPGKDLDMLKERYTATGSDYSKIFLDRYGASTPGADLMQLDAVSIDTERRFDAIYSNKVLHHLNDDELAASINRQADVLTGSRLVMHAFWHGDRVEEIAGMTFHYRNEDFLRRAFSSRFEVLKLERYAEMEDNDSVFIIARAAESP